MKRIATVAMAGLSLAACQARGDDVSSVSAQEEPDPPVFAQALCAGCHAIKPLQLSPNPSAPSFSDIVNRHGVSRASLRRFLADAHNYPEVMDFDLEEHHVEELTDYMITLKSPQHRKTPY